MTSRPRLLTWRLVPAALLPAAAAAALVVALAPRSPAHAPVTLPPSPPSGAARLARAAAAPSPLRPIVLEDGHVTLGNGPAGPLTMHRRPAPPGVVSIPALHVRARIHRVRATRHGIQVPPIHQAGWYDAGPRPGEPGRAVLIGHLDSPTGAGVFGRVPALRRGARIGVTDVRGHGHTFRVVGKVEIRKSRFPTRDVYGAAPRPVLVLITCGGPYLPGIGYRDNVIVYARAAR